MFKNVKEIWGMAFGYFLKSVCAEFLYFLQKIKKLL